MSMTNNRGAWLVVGVLVGLVAGAMAPNAPLHASATHGQDNFAIATGEVDAGLEGIYFLDMVTGELSGFVLNPNTGRFTTAYKHNVLGDFGELNKPRFLMVTGGANLRQGPSTVRAGSSVIYVAEMSSGRFAAYAVPWVPGRAAANLTTAAPFRLLDKGEFRARAVRE